MPWALSSSQVLIQTASGILGFRDADLPFVRTLEGILQHYQHYHPGGFSMTTARWKVGSSNLQAFIDLPHSILLCKGCVC